MGSDDKMKFVRACVNETQGGERRADTSRFAVTTNKIRRVRVLYMYCTP